MIAAKSNAGYRITRVYVADQHYTIAGEDTQASSVEPEDRDVQFGWDWRPTAHRQFEVIIEISIGPTKAAPERGSVRIVGVFLAEDGDLSIPLPVFLTTNAPAILFPYAREVLSTMTGRGPHGAFHLNPINVAVLMSDFDVSKSSGVEFLDAHPDIATDFGLKYRSEAASSRSKRKQTDQRR
jgi:preprotein translocase subunit SecB